MERNEKKVPEFDDIIFENRNKEYGAYNLRKRYNSAISFSILGTLAFSIILTLALLFVKPEKGTASSGPPVIVIATIYDYITEIPEQPEVKLPPELVKAIQNVAPDIVTEPSEVTSYIPATDELISITTDGNVNDIPLTVDPIPDEIMPVEEKPFIVVEEPPSFPGGDAALLDFITRNTIYPSEAINNNIQGRVILKFVVDRDGSIGKIEILRSVDPLLDQEAVRVVSMIPRFSPGKQGGVPVPVWYSVPVLFRIQN
ncbi:MAG: energy transducer TonB [Bacteroidales bacterium]|nr:energy transducer TonB [Bacteroidales bacterium]